MMRRILLGAVILMALSISSVAHAQVTSPPSPVNGPIPGVGHDYIHMLSETVNPSDGSVNLSIKLPTRAGRGISVPFSITYNSGSAYYITSYQPGYEAASLLTSPSYGGWGNSLPYMTFSSTAIPYPFSDVPGSNSGTCYFASGYSFHDLSGAAHSLIGLGATSQPPSYYADCTNMGSNIPSFLPRSTGNDSQVSAMFTKMCSGPPGVDSEPYACNIYGQPPLAVFDAEGTIYSFPQGFVSYTGTLPIVFWPTTIEDRNGNITQIVAENGPGGGPVSVTDSTGQTLVSLTYPANSTVDPTTISAGGLTYDLSYGSSPVNFSFTGEALPSLGFTSTPSGLICSYQNTIGGTIGGLLSTITLPNGQKYSFYYDSTYGLLKEIIYPDGGWVKYTWEMSPVYEENSLFTGIFQNGTELANGCNSLYKVPVVATRQVGFAGSSTAALSQTFSYGASWDQTQGATDYWLTKTTTVQTTDNVTGKTAQRVYNYAPVTIPTLPGFGGGGAIGNVTAVEQSVQYFDWGQPTTTTPIKAVVKQWADQFNMTSEVTTLNGTSTSQVTYQYGFGGAVTQKQEYDNGSLLRSTATTYQTFPGNPMLPIQVQTLPSNLLTFPCQTIVYNGTVSSSNRVAETDYLYDGGTSTCGTAGTPSVTAASVPTGTHDETYYGPSSTTPASRGNVTTLMQQCFPGCATPSTVYAFDETGQVLSVTSPLHAVTRYSYADNYSSCGRSAPSSGNTNAYLTEITDPLAHTQKYCYGYTDGRPRSSTDANNQTTSYAYSDPLLRLTSTTNPDGGQTAVTYNDSVPSITASKLITAGVSQTSVGILDGMGHVIERELTSDPSGTDYTVTTYNGEGLVNTVTNPYRSTSDSTYGTTGYMYDALNRTTLVTKADGSKITTSYSGNCTTVTDEASKTRESCTDGLGRMKEVIENPGGLNWTTNYTFDALDDLTKVVQGGSHTRTFGYDSLKRLTSSLNPETGTTPVAYSYDADSHVSTKTDARGIKITYSWDTVNRLLGKTYSNGDPSVSNTYDQAGGGGCCNIGRRTTMTDVFGTETFGYDPMGRVLQERRTTPPVSPPCHMPPCPSAPIIRTTTYSYNLDGSLAILDYPSGAMNIGFTTDSAGRMSNAVELANGPTLVGGSCPNGSSGSNGLPTTGACYSPQGALSSYTLGSQINVTRIYNQRLQPCWLYATTGTGLATTTACSATDSTPGNILDLKYNFSLGTDNGNVIGITNNRNSARSQSFTYDQVNRIVSAQATPWSQAFGYDQWGNLTSATAVGTGPTPLSLTVNTNNQITTPGFSYDAAGNETTDVTFSYAWNAESELKSAAGLSYTYDGDGDRVEKSNFIYWYGAGNQVLDESLTSSPSGVLNEYVFFDGSRAVWRSGDSGFFNYYVQDMLGSSRVIVQSGQTTPCYDADFYPFGGETDYTNTCVAPTQNYKFDGKERDSETGNDYFGARFYASTYGRFLSADWSSIPAPVPYADLTNPQTLNLYAFVNDNPESFADLDGHATGCVSVMVSGSEDCNSPDNGSGIAGGQVFGQSPHPPDPPCKDGHTCSNTWVQKSSFWHKIKSWFSSPGSGGDSEWLSLFQRAWKAHDPKVTTVTDVSGIVAEVGDLPLLSRATAIISVVNDPSATNIGLTGAGLFPALSFPMAFIGAEADLLNWEVQTVGEGMIETIPADTMDNGNGQTVDTPQEMCDKHGLC